MSRQEIKIAMRQKKSNFEDLDQFQGLWWLPLLGKGIWFWWMKGWVNILIDNYYSKNSWYSLLLLYISTGLQGLLVIIWSFIKLEPKTNQKKVCRFGCQSCFCKRVFASKTANLWQNCLYCSNFQRSSNFKLGRFGAMVFYTYLAGAWQMELGRFMIGLNLGSFTWV